MRRPPVWIIFVIAILLMAAVAVGFSMIPTGFVAIEPHKPLDLAGKIRVDGRTTEPVHGRLLLVGVEVHPVNQLQKWLLELDPKVTLEADPGGNRKEDDARDKEAIASSKEIAAAVAFNLLGQPSTLRGDGAMVVRVDPKGPSAAALQTGDRIVRLNGRRVVTSIDLIHTISSLPPGSTVTLGVRRGNLPHLVKLTTAPPTPGDDLHRSRIGVDANTPNLKVTLPHKVDIDTENVEGPSAGLAFALAIYDSASPDDLVRGRYVVATGEVTLEGQVLRIGGVRQKTIAAIDDHAELMLVPRGNLAEARAAVTDFCPTNGQGCPRVIGVSSVQQAIKLLKMSSDELAANSATN